MPTTPKLNRKIIILLLCTTASIVLLFFIGRYFVYHKIKDAVNERVEQLREDGIDIAFESLQLDPWNGHLSAHTLKVTLGTDSSNRYVTASADLLQIKGVDILPFVFHQSLNIRSIVITSPRIIYSQNYKGVKAQGNSKPGKKLNDLSIAYVQLQDASLLLKDSLGRDTTASMLMNVVARHINMKGDSLIFTQADIALANIKITTPKSFYTYTIQQLLLNLDMKSIVLDSLRVIPKYDRVTFMKKAGEQTSRIEALVSHLSMKNILVAKNRQLQLSSQKTKVNFTLHVFRDKRYAFQKKTIAELPMEFLQKLPFTLALDSIAIQDSYVRYEEFAEKGDSVGYVFFDKLNSTILNLNNQPGGKDVTMYTTALFMGKGKLNAYFTFPSDTTKPYTTQGSLKDFPMASINSIIEPSFKTKIESGIMSDFKFNFMYNKTRSDGNVELNYDGLRVISMHKDKNDEKVISKFKTAVINLFIINRNSEASARGDKKTGTILYYRDPKRAVFHFWWKSLFSGIVTAYKLDGLVPDLKDHGKELRKEQKQRKRTTKN